MNVSRGESTDLKSQMAVIGAKYKFGEFGSHQIFNQDTMIKSVMSKQFANTHQILAIVRLSTTRTMFCRSLLERAQGPKPATLNFAYLRIADWEAVLRQVILSWCIIRIAYLIFFIFWGCRWCIGVVVKFFRHILVNNIYPSHFASWSVTMKCCNQQLI